MQRSFVTTLLRAFGLDFAIPSTTDRDRQHDHRWHERDGHHDHPHHGRHHKHRHPTRNARLVGYRSTLIRQAPRYQPPRRRERQDEHDSRSGSFSVARLGVD